MNYLKYLPTFVEHHGLSSGSSNVIHLLNVVFLKVNGSMQSFPSIVLHTTSGRNKKINVSIFTYKTGARHSGRRGYHSPFVHPDMTDKSKFELLGSF